MNHTKGAMAIVAGLLVLLMPRLGLADDSREIHALEAKIDEQAKVIANQQAIIQQLLNRMAALETRLEVRATPTSTTPKRVSLEAEELSALPAADAQGSVLERPWYQNIRLDGFGGAGFVWTGGDAAKEHGSFLNYEATVNVDAKVWEDIHYFHELQTIRLGDESTEFVRTGEIYVRFRDLLQTMFDLDGMGVGAKIGRMDIPVGEDYLTQDVIDNPLITLSAAYPYGLDEGIVLHGTLKGVNWIAAVMEGTDTRAFEDNADKFLSLKLSGNPTARLYLSASGFWNGESAESAWEFGGAHLVPVGAGSLTSSAGRSGSDSVDAYSYELDARYELGQDRYLKAQYGFAFVDDDQSAFDRSIHYVQIEPKWNLGPAFKHKAYLVGRFSAVGTFNQEEGYAFDGKPFAGGRSAYGFDVKALYRWALGLGYWVNPRTLVKLEYSVDDFHLIEQSSVNAEAEQRDLFGILVAAKF